MVMKNNCKITENLGKPCKIKGVLVNVQQAVQLCTARYFENKNCKPDAKHTRTRCLRKRYPSASKMH